MMVASGAFPAAKLGALLLRQVSKPVANWAKERAKKSPWFRSYVCMPPAQMYNWCEVKLSRYFMNVGTAGKVKPLSELAAIELGSDLFGETIIFSIAAAVMLSEYNRQSRKEQAKENVRLKEREKLYGVISDLKSRAEQNNAEIQRIARIIDDLK